MWGNQGGQNLLSPNAETDYSNLFYNTYENPAIQQQATNEYAQGMQNSSFGGAELGTMMAQGEAQAGLAGQQYYTNALNNWLNTRSNYFGNDIGTAENAAQGQLNAQGLQIQNNQNSAQDALQAAGINSNQNLALAGYAYQSPQLENTYGLNASNLANQFALGEYNTGAGIYGSQLGYNAQTNQTNTQGELGLLGK
jgi:hypothetical protein